MRKSLVHPFIHLILSGLLIVLSSCEKKKDIHEADLIGTWDIGQPAVDIKVGPISLLKFLETSLMYTEEEAQDYVDQLTAEYIGMGGGTITFNADYSYLILNTDLEEGGDWSLEGDKLYLTNTDGVLENNPLIIESLNSSSAFFVWEMDYEVETGEGIVNSFTATIIIELDLSKQ